MDQGIVDLNFSLQNTGKKGLKRLIINSCPVCGRMGVVRLRRVSKTRVRFDVEHWILYANQREMISSMRRRNERCKIDEEDEIFEMMLKEYMKFRRIIL